MKKVYIKRNDLFKNINMVLFDKITEVDESFIEDNYNLFFDECEECKGEKDKMKDCTECNGEGRNESEPYQYFACNINEFYKEYLESFGVMVGYSEKLDLSIIPIYDFGTSWDMFSYSKEVEYNYTLGYNETLERQTHY